VLDWPIFACSNFAIEHNGADLRKKALIVLAAFGLAPAMAFSAEAESQATEFSYKFRRGGSFSMEPAFLLPMAPLEKVFHNTLGYNVNFDIGVSPDISVLFGGGYYNLQGRRNPDYYLVMTPVWAGVKSKNQVLPTVEVYWEACAALYYQKAYLIQSSTGAIENLDGGGILGSGFDVWWTRWLMSGLDVRFHVIYEAGQVYPFTQIGLRVGIRG
jgi:hypothetical protein